MRVAVAMSGGVDSSVAAHIVRSSGHEVLGLTMDVWPCGAQEGEDARVCCGPGALREARRVADVLGIRHYVLGMRELFQERVVRHFADEYAAGRTPNPCVRCNRFLKFGALLAKARGLGADALATGHHAIVRRAAPDGLFELLRPRDRAKDQTYFLYALTQDTLARVLFPVGTLTKEEIRQHARDAGLPVAERAESQDVCFIGKSGIATLVGALAPGALAPGPIEDASGRVLGTHSGIARYTVGQRRGLGLSRPDPMYVVGIDARRNTIIVGGDHELSARELVASAPTWVAGAPPSAAFRARAKIRYASPLTGCSVALSEGEARVTFDEPQRAITPGQAVVLYDGDAVLGGATIEGRLPTPTSASSGS